eukprot:PLAT6657.1.p1 GENE.PLAT6657.1~~PLAT6657.1.p1  ORF type:complete len:517 (-),score=208.91 PLAT6657.1:852-2402(-)
MSDAPSAEVKEDDIAVEMVEEEPKTDTDADASFEEELAKLPPRLARRLRAARARDRARQSAVKRKRAEGEEKKDGDDLAIGLVLSPDPGSPAMQALEADVKRRRKRPHLRKKKKKKKDKLITLEHEHYALTYGMMLGIRLSVGHVSPTDDSDVQMSDFMHTDKYVFPPGGSARTPPHKLKHTFKMKDYAARVFRLVRRRFGINDADYMLSLCGDFNYIEFISNSKSGQFFFYSHDGRFMIKTQTADESSFLRRILPYYYKHIITNRNTLMTRFYGMHRVKMHHIRRRMHFVIMGSVFFSDKEIHEKYDLKGSTVGRKASEKDRAKADCVYKDLDLLEKKLKIHLGAERRDMLLDILQADASFLREMKIMDYSLLLGIHYKDKADVRGVRRSSVTLSDSWAHFAGDLSELDAGAVPAGEPTGEDEAGSGSGAGLASEEPTNALYSSEDGGVDGQTEDGSPTNEIYYLGIIDILQQYNGLKRTENVLKAFIHDRKQISAVDPAWYAERFVSFIADATE